jgi:hypothetical protein
VKKIITKRQIRSQIDQQIDDYLKQGGQVEQVDQGVSGRDSTTGPTNQNISFDQPKQARTYIPEVIAALDERKKPKVAARQKRKTKPRKKIIYDDFGEPLRWEWVEE